MDRQAWLERERLLARGGDDERRLRRHELLRFGLIDDGRPVTDWLRLAGSADVAEQVEGLAGLASMGGEGDFAVEELTAALESDSRLVRMAALDALEQTGLAAEVLPDKVAEWADRRELEVERFQAERILAGRERGIAALVADQPAAAVLLDDGETPEGREWAWMELTGVYDAWPVIAGFEGLPRGAIEELQGLADLCLMTLAQDPKALRHCMRIHERELAAECLRRLGRLAWDLCPGLARILGAGFEHGDDDVLVCEGLIQSCPELSWVVRKLSPLALDPDHSSAALALYHLGRLGKHLETPEELNTPLAYELRRFYDAVGYLWEIERDESGLYRLPDPDLEAARALLRLLASHAAEGEQAAVAA